jgi:hypothetical protein
LTAGAIRARPQTSRSLAAEKLETPMERTRPASTRASIARHVSSVDGRGAAPSATGQWIM